MTSNTLGSNHTKTTEGTSVDKRYVVFFDMDGVLAEFRSENKCYQTEDELSTKEYFLELNPVVHNLIVLKEFIDAVDVNSKVMDVMVLTVANSPNAVKAKKAWLKSWLDTKNFPTMVFVKTAEEKIERMRWYRDFMQNDFKGFNCVLIDDTIDTLFKAEREGFIALHPSSLLTNTYKQFL